MDESFTTAPELARQLRVDPKRLRDLIRAKNLMPGHEHGKRYRLAAADIARIASDPAVRALRRI